MASNQRYGKIIIIGMGPGAKEYLPPISLTKISNAEILIGGKRHLEQFADLNIASKEINGNLEGLRFFIQEKYQEQQIVILVSGDPGFHSILTYLSRYFARETFEVIPGISSIQLAFCKLALPWQDASLLSLHGKKIEILQDYLTKAKLGLLTDTVNTPQAIAKIYVADGRLDKIIYTCENLSYPDENIQKYRAEELCQEAREIRNCVVIVCDP